MAAKKKNKSLPKEPQKDKKMTDLSALIPTTTSLTPPARRVKPKSKSTDPWSSVRYRKQHPLTSKMGLFRYFCDMIRSNLIDVKVIFNPDQHEIIAAGEILDVLRDNNCEDDATIKAWIDWYIKEYIRNRNFVKRDLLTVRSLLKSWPRFAPVRPAEVYPGKAAVESKKHDAPAVVKRTILQELELILRETADVVAVRKGLYLFGIVVVANYLAHKVEESKSMSLIGEVLASAHNSLTGKNDLQLIHSVTCRHGAPATGVLLSDWRERYIEHWKWAGCKEMRPEPYYANRAREFFEGV